MRKLEFLQIVFRNQIELKGKKRKVQDNLHHWLVINVSPAGWGRAAGNFWLSVWLGSLHHNHNHTGITIIITFQYFSLLWANNVNFFMGLSRILLLTFAAWARGAGWRWARRHGSRSRRARGWCPGPPSPPSTASASTGPRSLWALKQRFRIEVLMVWFKSCPNCQSLSVTVKSSGLVDPHFNWMIQLSVLLSPLCRRWPPCPPWAPSWWSSTQLSW